MRINWSITWDIETWAEQARDDFWYEGPLELCGPSQSESTAQAQSAAEASSMMADFTQQFGEQQSLLNNTLIPQLEGMISNPQGFGATAIADMNANLVNTVGQQALNAKQSSAQNFDTNNLAGLPSGVQQVVQSGIASGAGNAIASGSNQIQLANSQEKLQQQQQGLSGLMSAESALGAAPQTGALAENAKNSAFSQAYSMQQQGNWWQPILGGVLNSGLSLATGGLGNLFSSGAPATAGANAGNIGAGGYTGGQTGGGIGSTVAPGGVGSR